MRKKQKHTEYGEKCLANGSVSMKAQQIGGFFNKHNCVPNP